MKIDGDNILNFKTYYGYEKNDFSSDDLSGAIKKTVIKLESHNNKVFEASDAYYEDEYPRLYLAIKETDEILNNLLKLKDFDIQIFRNEDNDSEAVVIIERHFLNDEYCEEEFNKEQHQLINTLNNWIEDNLL